MSGRLDVLSSVPAVLDRLPLRIDRDEVLRFLGYKTALDVPTAEVLTLFDEALALGTRLMVPRVVYRGVPLTTASAHRIDAGGEQLDIPGIARRWGTIAWVGIAVCTVGDAIEERARVLFDEREFPLAVMLDAVGSGAVESLAEHVNDVLCQEALLHGLKVTNRISPGYAGWDTAEQTKLFRLCPGAPIGVTLNAACFMSPLKSLSLVVGFGARARVDHYFSQCRRCWMRDCAYRRAPAAGSVSG